MTRPLYETTQDLSNEQEFMQQLESLWGCTSQKIPIKYGVDFCLMMGDVIKGILEIKCRNNTRLQYPTYMLSAHKIITGRNLAQIIGVPFLLAVKWTDSSGYIDLAKTDSAVFKIGGRFDRNDPDDIEPVAHIPIGEFKTIGG